MKTVILLLISNIFMTFAWYGHLRFKTAPLWKAILASWAIAFVEYCFQVPANRIGHGRFTAAQLKTIQEVITLVVFAAFSGRGDARRRNSNLPKHPARKAEPMRWFHRLTDWRCGAA